MEVNTVLISRNDDFLFNESSYLTSLPVGRDDVISSFDFDPEGGFIALLDQQGTCSLVDVNTNNYCLQLDTNTDTGDDYYLI